MNFKIYLEYVLTLSVFNGIRCTLVERHYQSSQSIASTLNSEFRTNVTRRSKIECAAACRHENSFSFNKETRQCSMSSGITENISDRVYYSTIPVTVARECPTATGYTLWTYGGMSRCLKYFITEKFIYAHAMANCEEDGGHLALIENDNVRQLIKDFLVAVGATPAFTWFDGFDFGNKDIFQTRNRELLWVSWAADNPTHAAGQDCMAGRMDDDYLSRDAICSKERPSVCQIDLV